MIEKIRQEQYSQVLDILKKSYFKNPYLYIDAVSFGFSGENIETYLFYENDEIAVVIYRYYNSLQICALIEEVSVFEIVEFIKNGNFDMISGNAYIIKSLEVGLKEFYTAHFGSIMMFNKRKGLEQTGNQIMAEPKDCAEIARLICTDQAIGGHYSPDVLQKQLEERMLHFGCKNAIIKEHGKIVAHAATYADCNEFAIIGGVITDLQCRGKGYGGSVVAFLTKQLLIEDKSPLLYCYESKTVKWYEKNGWEICAQCGKLEGKKNDL